MCEVDVVDGEVEGVEKDIRPMVTLGVQCQVATRHLGHHHVDGSGFGFNRLEALSESKIPGILIVARHTLEGR